MSQAVAIYRLTGEGPGKPIAGVTLTLTNDINTTQELNFIGFSGGNIIIPSGSGITTLTFYGSDKQGGTYAPVYDGTLAGPVAQSITTIDASGHAVGVPIPDACFAYAALKIVANTTGTVTATLKG